MFKWYQLAKVCYAYLSDVRSGIHAHNETSAFARSRWFTRGWTLQELIAPKQLHFFANDWNVIGDKISLSFELQMITGIDEEVLKTGDLSRSSIAREMS